MLIAIRNYLLFLSATGHKHKRLDAKAMNILFICHFTFSSVL